MYKTGTCFQGVEKDIEKVKRQLWAYNISEYFFYLKYFEKNLVKFQIQGYPDFNF
jgi:hypothetical protein